MPKIDPEFFNLISPLSAEERGQLEENLLKDGCRDALVVWDGLILDGHTRYQICTKHGIPFETREQACVDRNAAKAWIIRNQLGRRNLTDYQRGELVLKLKPLLAAKAKANLKTSTGGSNPRPLSKLSKAENTRADLAKASGLSEGTIRKVEKLVEAAPEPVKADLRAGKISVDRAYREVKGATEQPEKKRPVAGPPQKGLHFAGIAKTALAQIEDDDLEREEAFESVREWLAGHGRLKHSRELGRHWREASTRERDMFLSERGLCRAPKDKPAVARTRAPRSSTRRVEAEVTTRLNETLKALEARA